MTYRLLALVLAPLALAACATAPVAQTDLAASAAPPSGVVSAADPRAAEAGAQILRQGGSSTDAAIAVMLALTVVEPQSSGIGGGGFFMLGTADGEVVTLDGRERAPAGATPGWFLDASGAPRPFGEAVLTGLSIGVPGNVALAAEAHERYGRLPWADLFAPAIALARNGWVLTPRAQEFLGQAANRAGLTAEGRALFYDAAGAPLAVGTLVRNPALAATLETLALGGQQAFYRGPMAAGMADVIAAATPNDTPMTPEDFAGYSAQWRDSPCGTYRQYRVCGMGPPSSGATTVYAMLRQLERFDLSALGPDNPVSWHLFAESQRLAYADRELYLADGDFVRVPMSGLMDADYLAQRGELISATSRMSTAVAGTPPGARLAVADGDEPAENGTSHFVVVDQWGMAVTYTSTVEGPYGSGHMYGGFYLNNELTDFSLSPDVNGVPVVNRVEGGKRPRSSMAPTLVYGPDGTLVLVIGAAGGGTIPVQVAKALIGVIDWGLPVDQAIALPGIYAPGNDLVVEQGSPLLSMRAELEALGHRLVERRLPFKANGAQRVNGQWIGAADPRSEGVALHP